MLNGAKLLTMWSVMIIANKCVKEGKKKSSQKALFLTKIHKHEAAWVLIEKLRFFADNSLKFTFWQK